MAKSPPDSREATGPRSGGAREDLAPYLFQHAVLRIHHASYFEPDRSWGMDGRRIDDWQLYAFYSGRGHFSQSGTECDVAEGDVILCAPREPYSLNYKGPAPLRHVSVHFTLLFPGEVDLMAWLRPPARITHESLRPVLPMLSAAAREKGILARERVRGLLTWLLAEMISRSPLSMARGGRTDKLAVLLKFQRAVAARIDEPKALRLILADLGLGMPALEKETRRLTGKRPLQLILEAKIARAGELLSAGMSVTATAERLGFSDVYYFSKMFKKTAGMSPKRWLESLERG
jgi:AraC-like DNA-binding protein